MSIIKTFTNPEATADALSRYIKQKIDGAPESFYLAVSGGSTPKMLFQSLVKIKNEIPWQKIQLYWVDERCVPPTDKESNFRMTAEFMLNKVPLLINNIHSIKGDLKPEEALMHYIEEIKLVPERNGYPQFDLIVLGMGDDGHTASIFPPEKKLIDIDNPVAIGTNPYNGQKRITLTGKTINNASEVIFHVTGKSKAKVLNEIVFKKNNYAKYPASYIDNGGKTYWFVDEEVVR
jgi:6-phosphogluconolactonase